MASSATATRRGLVFTLYSEVLLVLGILAFLLLPGHPVRLFVWGVLASLAVGLPAAIAFWAGRLEFGPAHARGVRRTMAVFAILFLSLVLAFFEVTSVFPASLRLIDLRGPWFFLGLALLADAAAMILLLGPLTAGRARGWLLLVAALAVAGGVAYAWTGWRAVEHLLYVSQGHALNGAEAGSYASDFVESVVRPFAAALFLLRLGFWPALYVALTSVASAEREAEERAAFDQVFGGA